MKHKNENIMSAYGFAVVQACGAATFSAGEAVGAKRPAAINSSSVACMGQF